ncbi:Acyltransferase ato1 [Psilocybe cubensis]|uniref:Acyltransferase MbtK/IucB-like conserved domain-containing protein n=2 Tax=Psilocybe cubensis TaxID=181762 RepID=A0A8H8CNS5_PSICU|nr:Acyltransferase ato1 [Psilocybe cubensis]KAH9484827.1 Acyltransferase ato1 [Psilocybe cubensis]
MEASTAATRRLQTLRNHTSSSGKREQGTLLLVLPDGGKVSTALAIGEEKVNEIILNGSVILCYTISASKSYAFDITSIGTRYQGATTHIPKYNLYILSAPLSNSLPPRSNDISIPELWVGIYALFQLYPDNEYIPFVAPSIPNVEELKSYLLTTGLARAYPTSGIAPKNSIPTDDILFLSRATFWQGAGTTGYHRLSWILNPQIPFPSISAFTRNEKVIAQHPLRPSKPQPGEVLYRRWCSHVKQTFEITYFDLEGVHDGSKVLAGPKGLSRHMAAFHKWHNDERVNSAWGERGSLETHRDYIEGVLADPHVLPCMMSWDGELMGYTEIVYVKEDHVAQHYPTGITPGDWERGIHVLVGEDKFLGGGRSEIWLRSLVHYIFLADPRTDRVCGEPNHSNTPIIKVGSKSGFHLETLIDFPYKRSALILNPRENFFKLCRLR